ncbi:hypothetical protein BCU71_03435 [Vibrio lentus]|uniref:helix-turn-helix domain-containing protein n=1 Tax=Vibrio TaxID=662 RepID=UPI0006362F3F|nr:MULTISPECIES: helix-turn-helix domain-containing protein [Vibrio]PMH32622.1 hypothetical protein BCU71_03435 [Vibrio lentus]PMK70865.1 hypothetical protein BCT93_00210 [Vibrio lentus]CDT60420.1 conserved hypothetical protein [Vibrio coralliirubri]
MNIEVVKLYLAIAGESQVKKFNIVEALHSGEAQADIARKFGVTRGYVNQIKNACREATSNQS